MDLCRVCAVLGELVEPEAQGTSYKLRNGRAEPDSRQYLFDACRP